MKRLLERKDYLFNPVNKQIYLHSLFSQEQILLITNVTDGIIIYNFASPTGNGTLVGNVLTLDYDTSSMDALDDLQIYVDIPEEKVYSNTDSILQSIYIELKTIKELLANSL